MSNKLPGASGEKAKGKDKDDRKNWDLKQDMRFNQDLRHVEEALTKTLSTLRKVLTRRSAFDERMSKNKLER